MSKKKIAALTACIFLGVLLQWISGITFQRSVPEAVYAFYVVLLFLWIASYPESED